MQNMSKPKTTFAGMQKAYYEHFKEVTKQNKQI